MPGRDREPWLQSVRCARDGRAPHIAFLKKRTHLWVDFKALMQKNEPILSHFKPIFVSSLTTGGDSPP
jgi:hypothetical protein